MVRTEAHGLMKEEQRTKLQTFCWGICWGALHNLLMWLTCTKCDRVLVQTSVEFIHLLWYYFRLRTMSFSPRWMGQFSNISPMHEASQLSSQANCCRTALETRTRKSWSCTNCKASSAHLLPQSDWQVNDNHTPVHTSSSNHWGLWLPPSQRTHSSG